MPRTPARRFLAPNGRTTTQPLRPLPDHGLATPGIDPDIAREADLVATHSKLCDEPEFPSKATVSAMADLAKTYDRLRYLSDVESAQQSRRLLTIEQRMADAVRRAKIRHADITGEMHVIRQMLDRARKGGRPDPPSAIERIERIEARLDYRPDLADAA